MRILIAAFVGRIHKIAGAGNIVDDDIRFLFRGGQLLLLFGGQVNFVYIEDAGAVIMNNYFILGLIKIPPAESDGFIKLLNGVLLNRCLGIAGKSNTDHSKSSQDWL